MPADVRIQRYTGASPTPTDVTGQNMRAAAADIATTNDVDFPVRIPQTGTQYSYWISLRLNALTAPNGLINNIVWYTDGGNGLGAGVGLVVALARQGANSGYREATGVPGKTGTQLSVANHNGLAAEPVNAFQYTQNSPLIVSGSTSTTGAFGDYVVLQVTVSASAQPGTVTPEQVWFQYDET